MSRTVSDCLTGKWLYIIPVLTPASADNHSLMGGGVGNGTVVVDEGGVEGHPVYVQGHRGELDAERQVMPLTVTHLPRIQVKGQGSEYRGYVL